MARFKRADWLDRIILETRPGKTPKADFDAWRDAHTGAIKRLRQRGATLPPSTPFLTSVARLARNTLRNPITRLAVAAAVIAGIFILVSSRTARTSAPMDPTPTATDQATPAQSDGLDPAERELRSANELFVRGDVQGLLLLLHTGRPRTVFTVAAYLGQIGDISSIPTLQAFAAQWQGPAAKNPFQDAIDQIRHRLGQSDVKPSAPAQMPLVVVQPVEEPAPSGSKTPSVVCRGVVLNEIGAPIGGATVRLQRWTKDLRLMDVGAPARTDSQGRFNLTMPADGADAGRGVYLLCRRSGYAPGWLCLPSDQKTSDCNDLKIILYRPTVVAGTVTDVHGRAVTGAHVEARIVAAHSPASVQEYPYGRANMRTVSTNGIGRFVLADIPEGSLLSLSVSRRGYRSYDSREGYGRLLGTSPLLDPESYTIRAGREDVVIELPPAEGRIVGRILGDRGGLYAGQVAILCQDVTLTSIQSTCHYSERGCTLMQPMQRGVCTTDDNGRFTIEDLPTGHYWIAAIDPVSGDPITPPMSAMITTSQSRVAVTLQAGRVARLAVRVRKGTGEPVSNALVVARSGCMIHRYTDPNGFCAFRLVPGDYIITAHGLACHSEAATVRIPPEGKDQSLDILVDTPPQLSGSLTDESGRPVRGAVRLLAGEYAAALTDGEGRFTIPRSPGPLVGLATDVEGTRARLFSRSAGPGNLKLQIRLEPLATISGRIVDSNGNPADAAAVQYSLSASAFGSTELAFPVDLECRLLVSKGRFRFEVPAGQSLTLEVFHEGYQSRSQPIDPVPGQAYDLGDILLQPASVPGTETGQNSSPEGR